MNIKEKEPTTHTEAPQARLFAQHPRSGFGKLSVMALLGAAGTSGLLAIIIGFPANTALLIATASLLGGAALTTIRFRWMPLLLTLVSGLFLYQLLRAPFVLYHLTNPKGNGFLFFVMDVLLMAFTLIIVGASLGAAIQSYHQGEQRASSFRSPPLTGLVAGVTGMLIGALLIAAIVQPGAAPTTSTTSPNGAYERCQLHAVLGHHCQRLQVAPGGRRGRDPYSGEWLLAAWQGHSCARAGRAEREQCAGQ